jgi:hypothetical protein
MLMTLSVAHSGALPAIGNGLLVGDRIHSGLREAAFQRVVCAALFLCGVRLLLQQCSRCARPGGGGRS